MDIKTILTLAFTTGVATAILNQVIAWLRDHRHEQRAEKSDARYLAVRLVVTLEKYSADCIVQDWYIDTMLSEGQTELTCELPKLAAYPEDSSLWKSLHVRAPTLAERALLLPNKIAFAETSSEYSKNCEGYTTAIAEDVVVTGAEALILAREIRNEFGMDDTPLPNSKPLEQAYRKIQSRREKLKASREAAATA